MSKSIWYFILRLFEYLPLPPRARALLLRLSGAEVGEGVKICNGVSIRSKDLSEIKLGNGVFIGRNVEIDCKKLHVDSDAQINSQTMIYGNDCQIGRGSFIGSNVFIDATQKVNIEQRVVVANQAHIYTSDTSFAWIREGYPRKELSVTIKEGAWIGPQAVIIPGITIAPKTTVAGLSLIMKSTKPYSINMGIPAHQVGNQKEKITQHKKDYNTFKQLRKNLPGLLGVKTSTATDTDYIIHHQDKTIGVLFWQDEKNSFTAKITKACQQLDGLVIFIDGGMDELAEICQKIKNTLLVDISNQSYQGGELALVELIKARLRWWGIVLNPHKLQSL